MNSSLRAARTRAELETVYNALYVSNCPIVLDETHERTHLAEMCLFVYRVEHVLARENVLHKRLEDNQAAKLHQALRTKGS